jgi:hypothetical protein
MSPGLSKRSILLKALVASFAVYLIPIIGPHALWLLGEYIVRGGQDRAAAWIALECGLALVLQVLAGVLWYWFFDRPKWWRLLPLIVCVPLFFIVIEWAYLVAIPSRFLIEQETASESGNWKCVCTIADMSLAQVRSSPDLLLERAGQAWLIGKEINSYSVLEMPGCRTTPVGLQGVGPPCTQPYVLPAGRCLFSTWDNKTGQNSWWYQEGSGSGPRPLPHPPTDPNRSAPILSVDGSWVAWLEYIPGATVAPLPERVVIRSLRDDRERIVNLPMPGRSSFVLLGVNADTEELTFYEYEYGTRQSSLSVFGFGGERRGRPLVAGGVYPQATTFLRVGQQYWVAWDAYRENEPYRVAWSLLKGHGIHRILGGRSITALTVNPGGTYVAISTTTSLSIGHIKDAIYVLRTSDGVEVWRRYLPTYTRSSVAFLGDGFLAYTDWDGTHAAVRVLAIPD